MRSWRWVARASRCSSSSASRERGRHLRDEDRVVRVHERLPLLREHRVHRVAHLVRQREHVVERVGPVQEHVGMHAVDGGRVGAAALAVVFVDVDPALVEAAPHARLVVGAERLDRLDDRREHLVVGVAPVPVDDAGSRSRRGSTARASARACGGGDSAGAARRRRVWPQSACPAPIAGCCCRAAPRRASSCSRASARGTSRARRCRGSSVA